MITIMVISWGWMLKCMLVEDLKVVGSASVFMSVELL
jgi:hypothetical protein